MMYLLLAPVVLLAIYAFLAKVAFFGMKVPRQWDFESVPHDEFFARQTPEFMRYHQEMMAAGFALSETLFTQNMSPTVNDIATYRHEKATTVRAAIVSMSNAQLGNHFDYVEFYEHYTDDGSLSITNSSAMNAFPNLNHIVKIQCDDVQTVSELLKRFRQVRAKLGKTPAPLLPNMVAQFHEFHAREMQALVDAGYFRVSDDGKDYVGTYAGALKITWKLLPVGKQIAIAQKKRFAQKWFA
ncbi:hypothetical protein [Wielerella bovis]|uniref:hypothetical protein n=1 Tax=Wielerella bovis TaxID=2917790 RepID=UPI0020197F94|nr:hypothetical protein [Wielerella bovis]ULJ64416.1 hypothetical protein MIS33_09755 [Wielerella bovis]ULJ66695.1 hypothetical protein MIS31_10675 [Wielerella bovis]